MKKKNILTRILHKIYSILNFSKISGTFDEYYRSWIRNLDGPVGQKKRYVYYKKKLKHLGVGSMIDTGVYFYDCQFISIQDNVHIDKNCILAASPSNLDLSKRILKVNNNPDFHLEIGELYIGNNCHISQNCLVFGCYGTYIGDNCVLSTGSKVYSLTSMAYNPDDRSEIISVVPYDGKSPTLVGPIVLDENVWVGINVIVSPGITIGKNSFVRSNSVVMKSFGENSFIAGDPAIYTKKRFDVTKEAK